MLDELMRKIARFRDKWLGEDSEVESTVPERRKVESAFGEKSEMRESAFSKEDPVLKQEKLPAPQTLAEFVDMVKRTPKRVLSKEDRARIAAIMSFDERTVKDLMVPKRKMVFVKDTEILGPLVLDRLYKSGFTNFPVVDYNGKVLGIIHTEALNTLEVKDTERATEYLDTEVNYLHMDDTLEFAVQEIERTNSYYFLVLDDGGGLAGFFTVQMLLDYLLG